MPSTGARFFKVLKRTKHVIWLRFARQTPFLHRPRCSPLARIQVRIDRLSLGNPGNARPVGEGVSELRIDYGPGYRVYFLQMGEHFCCCAEATRAPRITTSPRRRRLQRNGLMAIETTPWDSAELLDTPEAVAAYIEAAFEDGDRANDEFPPPHAEERPKGASRSMGRKRNLGARTSFILRDGPFRASSG